MDKEKKNLLPHPDGPTKATVFPDGIFILTFFKT